MNSGPCRFYEDEDILAIDKLTLLLTSPDRYDGLIKPSVRLLHEESRGVRLGRSPSDFLSDERPPARFRNQRHSSFGQKQSPLVAREFVSIRKNTLKTTPSVHGVPLEKVQIDASSAYPVQTASCGTVPKTAKPPICGSRCARCLPVTPMLNCFPLTGRTHQVRVHLKHAGHPSWRTLFTAASASSMAPTPPSTRPKSHGPGDSPAGE